MVNFLKEICFNKSLLDPFFKLNTILLLKKFSRNKTTKLLTKKKFNSGDDLSCLHSTQLLTQLLTKLFVNTGDDLSCLHQASARIFGALGTRVELSKGGARAREGEVVIREGHGAVTCPLLA
jgi:hypothetical protein